eukprot:1687911-Prymnesium_polylepis.1
MIALSGLRQVDRDGRRPDGRRRHTHRRSQVVSHGRPQHRRCVRARRRRRRLRDAGELAAAAEAEHLAAVGHLAFGHLGGGVFSGGAAPAVGGGRTTRDGRAGASVEFRWLGAPVATIEQRTVL